MNTAENNVQRDAAPAIEVRELVKRYADKLALDYLNMNVRTGEIYGLLGPNGSGKTTAINCILGLLTYDSGQIRAFGGKMGPTAYDLKRRIGVVPQDVAVFNELTVQENIEYFCSLYVADKMRRARLVDEAIEFVGLEDCRNSILEGIKRLNERGATVVYTSHYMEEVEQICDRIQIIDHGRQIAIGTADELKRMIEAGERITVEAPALSANEALCQRAVSMLGDLEAVHEVTFENDELVVVCSQGEHNLIDVLQVLRSLDIPMGHVSSRAPTLNDVFLALTGTDLRD